MTSLNTTSNRASAQTAAKETPGVDVDLSVEQILASAITSETVLASDFIQAAKNMTLMQPTHEPLPSDSNDASAKIYFKSSSHHRLYDALVRIGNVVNTDAQLNSSQQQEVADNLTFEIQKMDQHATENWIDFLLSIPLVQPGELRQITTLINSCRG